MLCQRIAKFWLILYKNQKRVTKNQMNRKWKKKFKKKFKINHARSKQGEKRKRYDYC